MNPPSHASFPYELFTFFTIHLALLYGNFASRTLLFF
jgi:hypothetical protein